MVIYEFSFKWSLSLCSGMDYLDEDCQFLCNFSLNCFWSGVYVEYNVFYCENNIDFLLNYKDQWGDFFVDFFGGVNCFDQQVSIFQVQVLSFV